MILRPVMLRGVDMRLTLESTVSDDPYAENVTIKTKRDEYDVHDMLDYFRRIMVCAGYQIDSINRAIIEEGIMLKDEQSKADE